MKRILGVALSLCLVPGAAWSKCVLRQSTTETIVVGAFVDRNDGRTPETGLATVVTRISKDGAAFAAGPAIGTHDENGYYPLPFTTGHTDTLGELIVAVSDASVHLPYKKTCRVLPTVVYDALYAGTDNLDVDTVTTLSGHTPQTADHAANISAILIDTGLYDTDAERRVAQDAALVNYDAATGTEMATAQTDLDLYDTDAERRVAQDAALVNYDAATGTEAAAIQTEVNKIGLADAGAGVAGSLTEEIEDIIPRGDVAWITGGASPNPTGTCDSGSVTTCVDTERTEADDEYFTDSWIRFTSGTLNGQTRLISGFTAASDTITLAKATTVAVSTHTYEIVPAAEITGASAPTVVQIRTEMDDNSADLNTIIADLATAQTDLDLYDTDAERRVAQDAALVAYDPPTDTEMIARTRLTADYFEETDDPVELLDSGGTAGTSAAEMQADITGGAYALDTGSGGRVRIEDGDGAGEVQLTNGRVAVNFQLSHSMFIPSASTRTATSADAYSIADTTITTSLENYLFNFEVCPTSGDNYYLCRRVVYYDGTAKKFHVYPKWIFTTGHGVGTLFRVNYARSSPFDNFADHGRAQAGTASTITLRAGASATTDEYLWARVRLLGGTGVEQTASVTAYNGTTKVATIKPAWRVNPDSTTVYIVTALGDELRADWADAGRLDAILDARASQTTADAIETDTQDLQTQIGTAGAGLTDLGGMSTGMKAEVEIEATDALNAYDPPTNAEMVANERGTDDALQPSTLGRTLDITVNGEAGINLDNASGTLDRPTETSGFFDPTAAVVDLGEILGTPIVETNAGDISESWAQFWDVDPVTTNDVDDVGGGGGGTSSDLLQNTTIATLTDQATFTLTAGSADDDAYPAGSIVVVTDSVTTEQKAVGYMADYDGATKTVSLRADPGIFTMAVGDTVDIIATGSTDADIDQILTSTNKIGAAQVIVTAPVAKTGLVTIIQGDSYMAAQSRALDFSLDSNPDLSVATIIMDVEFNGIPVPGSPFSGSVVTATADAGLVRVELTSAQTTLLTPAVVHTYRVTATIGGNLMTLIGYTMQVEERP